MGHQSTASASVYGYKVSGRGSVAVKPTGATVAKVRKVCPASSARLIAQARIQRTSGAKFRHLKIQ